MNDPDARTSARKAHRRITALTLELREMSENLHEIEAKIPPKPSWCDGLCKLCGLPCAGTYCHAHQWAEGT